MYKKYSVQFYFHICSEYKPIIVRIGAYRNFFNLKNLSNLPEATNQRTASNHMTPMWQFNMSDFPQGVFITAEFVEITDKAIFDQLTNIHGIGLLISHAKSEEKSDKQQQRLYKFHKRDEMATNEKEVSKTCVKKLSIPDKTDVHNNNNHDGTLSMSNRGELSSRNSAAVDSPNVPSEAQAIVDKYLQSQRDSGDRAKKKYTDYHSVQEAASDKCNERSVKCKEMRQQHSAEWKRHTRSLPEFSKYEQ